MRIIITCAFLFFCVLSFAQVRNVSSGYITFNSGAIVNFKNLTIKNNDINYLNEVSGQEMKFSLNAVRKIVDNTGVIIYEAINKNMTDFNVNDNVKKVIASRDKGENEKMVYLSSSKIMLNGRRLEDQEIKTLFNPTGLYTNYKEGKNQAVLGKVLIWGGLGLFIGGGISNVMNANNGNDGSPAILIVGIATSVIGVPIKIGGNKKIKSAIEKYNTMPVNNSVSENKFSLNIIGGSRGVGLQFQF